MPVSLSKPLTADDAAEPFNALKKFQKDHGVAPTGTTKPDDATLRLLKRKGDRITLSVHATHGFNDSYDFDGGVGNLPNEIIFSEQ